MGKLVPTCPRLSGSFWKFCPLKGSIQWTTATCTVPLCLHNIMSERCVPITIEVHKPILILVFITEQKLVSVNKIEGKAQP